MKKIKHMTLKKEKRGSQEKIRVWSTPSMGKKIPRDG